MRPASRLITAAWDAGVFPQCGWLDVPTVTKLKALEDASSAAALAKATDAEKAEFAANDAPKERGWVNAHRYFDTQLACC